MQTPLAHTPLRAAESRVSSRSHGTRHIPRLRPHTAHGAHRWHPSAPSPHPSHPRPRLLSFPQLDATEEKTVAGKHEVQGYPTLKWFVDGKEAMDYSGGRTA